MSNSDSLSSYSTFSSSSLKSGAKALQFSWRQIIPLSWKLAERMVMKRGSWGETPVLYMTGAKIPLSKNINRQNFQYFCPLQAQTNMSRMTQLLFSQSCTLFTSFGQMLLYIYTQHTWIVCPGSGHEGQRPTHAYHLDATM